MTSFQLPKVCVLILAFNNVSDTLECVESVTALNYSAIEILVVDNGSTDDTRIVVERRFPDVRIVRLDSNVGIPGGYNLGIRLALGRGAKYIFLLNNDTVVAPELLTTLVNHAESRPNLAIAMPKILYYDHRDLVWSAGARYRRIPPAIVFIGLGKPDRQYNAVRPVEYAPSCGLLIRREAFERVGLFDDGYRFYYDDWDFSIRVRHAGMAIEFVPSARMWHKISRTIRNRRDEFWTVFGESAARFYRRHGRPAYLSLPIHLGYIAVRELVQGKGRSLPYFFLGVIRGLGAKLNPYPRLDDTGVTGGI